MVSVAILIFFLTFKGTVSHVLPQWMIFVLDDFMVSSNLRYIHFFKLQKHNCPFYHFLHNEHYMEFLLQ